MINMNDVTVGFDMILIIFGFINDSQKGIIMDMSILIAHNWSINITISEYTLDTQPKSILFSNIADIKYQ